MIRAETPYNPSNESHHNRFVLAFIRIILGETFLFVLVFSIVLYGKVVDHINSQEETLSAVFNTNALKPERWIQEKLRESKFLAENQIIMDYLADTSDQQKAREAENIMLFAYSGDVNLDTIGLVLYNKNDVITDIKLNNKTYVAKSGLLIADTKDPAEAVGTDLSQQDYLIRLFEKDYDYYIGAVKPSAIEGRSPSFVIARRVENNGVLLGAIIFVIDLENFSQNFANIFLGRTGQTFVVDDRGLFVSYPLNQQRILSPIEERDHLPPMEQIRKESVFRAYTVGKHYRYFYYSTKLDESTRVAFPFYMVFRQDAKEVLSAVYQTIIIDAIIGALIIIVSTILLLWSSRRFTKTISIEQQKVFDATQLLHEINVTDRLTGLYNRHFFEVMSEEIERNGINYALILGDLDGLKLINDAFGHIEGDILINRAKTILRGALPKYYVARFGGDEFAIILPNVSQQEALLHFTRLSESIEHYNRHSESQIIPTSISFGMAYYNGIGSFKEIIDIADKELYKTKSIRSPIIRKKSLEIFLNYLRELSPEKECRVATLENLCCRVAQYYEPGLLKLADLKRLIRYHNLGEITALGLKELNSTVSSTEVGYRIAMYLPEISGIADLILKQSEHYDGSGSMHLSGNDIPLECLIFTACRIFDDNYIFGGFHYAINQLHEQKSTFFDPFVVSYISQVAPFIYN